MSRPLIGITMGDPAGIGPEICLRALQDERVQGLCVPVVFGRAAILRRVGERLGLSVPVPSVRYEDWRGDAGSGPHLVDVGELDANAVEPGVVCNACGRAAADYIEAAVQAAMDRRVAAIATAPIHKEALRLAGVPYPGHTEMLAALTGAGPVCMVMASDDIVVSLATTHVALAEVTFHLTTERIKQAIALTGTALRRVLGREPRMVVCGLNPHAGEHGLFGDEEARIIRPAVNAMHRAGWKLEGPLAPDTAFLPERRRETDAYVVMYHDQGLIPFKMLAFETGVNVTLGLPIVRTSVDHGTAFDIAWQGKASARSLVESVRWAVRLMGERRPGA